MTAGIARFNATFGSPGTEFRCLYSRNNPGKVLRNLTDEARYIYQIIFAGVFVLVCVCGFIFAIRSVDSCYSRRKQCSKDIQQQNFEFATEMEKLQTIENNRQPVLILQSESGYQLIPQSLFHTQYAMNAINQHQPAGGYVYGLPAGQFTAGQLGNYSTPDCYVSLPGGNFTQPATNDTPPTRNGIPPAGNGMSVGQHIPSVGQHIPSAGLHTPSTGSDPPPQYADL